MVEILEGAELTLKARLPGTVARSGKEREREREREVRSRGAADVILVGEKEHGGAILGDEERTDCVAIVAPQLPNSTVSLFLSSSCLEKERIEKCHAYGTKLHCGSAVPIHNKNKTLNGWS